MFSQIFKTFGSFEHEFEGSKFSKKTGGKNSRNSSFKKYDPV